MSLIDKPTQEKILIIWTHYKKNRNTTKNVAPLFEEIDDKRLEAIKEINEMINLFVGNKINVLEFKTNIDSYNKRNNLWGFTAAKGQMFFNLLTKSSEDKLTQFAKLLQSVVVEPTSLQDALNKIKALFDYTAQFSSVSEQKKKAANPKSAAYFLSYFWQIQNCEKWPVMYTSLIASFLDLGIWQDHTTAQENYNQFYVLNEQIKQLIQENTNEKVTNWDVEHAFWRYAGTASVNSKQLKKISHKELTPVTIKVNPTVTNEVKVTNPGLH